MSFYIKTGERNPPLQAQFLSGSNYVNLSGASVAFYFKNRFNETGNVSTGLANIISAPSGLVEYDWAANDLGVPGEFIGEFRAILGNGNVLHYPIETYIDFSVNSPLF